MPESDNAELVTVFETTDPALLPLATSALEQAAIDYGFRTAEWQFPTVFGHPPAFGEFDGAVEVVVRASDAGRARDLLADLETPASGAPAVAPPPLPATGRRAPGEVKTVTLMDTGNGKLVGRITDTQLQFLVDELEEESSADRDYYIDAATIDVLAGAGADADLIDVLRRAIASRDGVELRWTHD